MTTRDACPACGRRNLYRCGTAGKGCGWILACGACHHYPAGTEGEYEDDPLSADDHAFIARMRAGIKEIP